MGGTTEENIKSFGEGRTVGAVYDRAEAVIDRPYRSSSTAMGALSSQPVGNRLLSGGLCVLFCSLFFCFISFMLSVRISLLCSFALFCCFVRSVFSFFLGSLRRLFSCFRSFV